MTRFLLTIICLLPLFLSAETIVVKTKAPQNRNAVFQYRVPNGYDKDRREMYRVLVIFGGRNTYVNPPDFFEPVANTEKIILPPHDTGEFSFMLSSSDIHDKNEK